MSSLTSGCYREINLELSVRLFFFFIRPGVTRRVNVSATNAAARDKCTKCWLAT